MSKINGRAKKYDGTSIDYVQVFNWVTGNCIGVSRPDAAGNWSYNLYGEIHTGFTYVADGCEPIAHGPYYFNFPFDSDWSKVSLLLHLDNNIVDSSGICTFDNLGVITFKAGYFDSAVELLPASSSSINGLLENTVSNSALSLGADDYTIEFFINPYSTYKQNDQALISLFEVGGTAGWQILLSGLKPAMYKYDNGGNTFLKSSTTLTSNKWYHIAYCRLNGITSLYIDGIADASAPDNSNYSSSNIKLSIGYQEGGGARYPFTGMIDDIRITKGLARYNGNFSPPITPFDHGTDGY